ncbi:HpcH/HpaI aldolase family protein [Catenulispora rubra]|uniref:HpcH/HpaI aldolase family protein n=1 Tax=Catenulispora rubra TaxID=280293 RepID=UPI001892755E|nr:aldolase/citrate lyase family protein [Catenulispora rubra]
MRTPPRRIRDKIEAGEAVYGATIQLPSPESVEIAGYAGLDFAWIDAEHGTMDLADINHLIRAADAVGIDSVVRVPDHTPSFIQRVLDAGATGIMVPHIRTVEQARAVFAAAHYAPHGTRGACPSTRSVGGITEDWIADARRADADVLVFGLIEDEEGVRNVEAIAADAGLFGLLAGPFDLSMELGLMGAVDDDRVAGMQQRIAAAAKAAGIEYVAIPAWEPCDLPTMLADGVRLFNITGDRGVLYTEFVKARLGFAEAVLSARSEVSA